MSNQLTRVEIEAEHKIPGEVILESIYGIDIKGFLTASDSAIVHKMLLASKYEITGLLDVIHSEFLASFKDPNDKDQLRDFCVTSSIFYEKSCEDTEALREMVVGTCVRQITTLRTAPEFKDLFEAQPELAFDLVVALTEKAGQ